ncbi:LysM peptidoglycan-binding domain-containing protein [Weissella ceti]|uniref:LysM peptidoglycan-binding domain-containing protein n=1 Tax=Weissella ceti TaxID=759620 RepID=A0ABT3E3I4_9LACO|nr:LysM domain-containing protein [Weissella ceti]MCW0952947.1 LysM peptidoglycan-binding domain-containing protein [Weissella ceti]QVK11493.1 LysM peptidoglycan-binding domain-containing protein [Weissella ceti]
MSENEEKVQKDSQEPWDNSFSGSKPEQTSRVAHRRKTQQVRVIIGVLIAAVVALSMVPVIGYLQTLNQPTSQEQAWSKTMTSETKVTSFSSDAAKSEEKAAAKKAEAESQKAQEEAKKAADQESKAESKSEDKNKDKDKDQKTVAVEAGQGAFRVATNAGITVDELRTLNPGVNIDSLSAGQMLRVK